MTENSRLAYSIVEAARMSGVSRSTLYEVIANGELPVRKLGRRTLVLHGDLTAWLQSLPTNPELDRPEA